MSTVLSKTRNPHLYLIVVLAFMVVALLTFAVVQAFTSPRATAIPGIGVAAAGSDYYERHPELKVPGAVGID